METTCGMIRLQRGGVGRAPYRWLEIGGNSWSEALGLCGSGDGGVDIYIEDDGVVLLRRGVKFAVEGGEGPEKKAASVGHDGGAPRSDFVASEEFVKLAEGAVDGDGAEQCGTTGLGSKRTMVSSFIGGSFQR